MGDICCIRARDGARPMLAGPRRTELARDERGAIMLMCVPMIFLMIGFLYYMMGTGDQLVVRERLQDAADAAALAGAVMQARGMNILALTNQVMAGLVALLVMLRLFTMLMEITAFVAAALSFVTYGASMAVVPPTSSAGRVSDAAFQKLQPVVKKANEGLHLFEQVIKYGMPVAAELRVIDIVSGSYSPPAKFGFAVPDLSKYPLPVEDGDWTELCAKAGEYAGHLLRAPIDVVIPLKIVGDGVAGAVDTLVSAAPGMFCGDFGINTPTKLPDTLKLPDNEFPIPSTAAQKDCNGAYHKATSIDQADVISSAQRPFSDDYDRELAGADVEGGPPVDGSNTRHDQSKTCERASADTALVKPDDRGEPTRTCRFSYDPTARSVEEARLTERGCDTCDECDKSRSGCLQGNEACSEFVTLSQDAAQNCTPGAGDPPKVKWIWQERKVTAHISLIPVEDQQGKFTIEIGKVTDTDAATSDQKTNELRAGSDGQGDPQPPCGPGGQIAETWNAGARYRSGTYGSNMLCAQDEDYFPATLEVWEKHAESEPATLAEWHDRIRGTWDDGSGAAGGLDRDLVGSAGGFLDIPSRAGSSAAGNFDPLSTSTEWDVSFRAATYIHSCKASINALDGAKLSDIKSGVPEIKMNEPSGEYDPETRCGSGKSTHSRMIQDPLPQLGGELFQIRSVVYGEARSQAAQRVVRNVPQRLRGHSEEFSGLAPDTEFLRSLFFAQAEYFFDTPYDARAPEELQRPSALWLWEMNWRARMRRVRPASDGADNPKKKGNQGNSGQASGSKSGAGQSGNATSASTGRLEPEEARKCGEESGMTDGPMPDMSHACDAAGGGDACGVFETIGASGGGDGDPLGPLLELIPRSLMVH